MSNGDMAEVTHRNGNTYASRKYLDGKLRCRKHNNGEGEWLPVDHFHEKVRASTGRSSSCKECANAYNRRKNAAQREKYAAEHPKPKINWLTAIPVRQDKLSNFMARNLWNQSLNFERLRA